MTPQVMEREQQFGTDTIDPFDQLDIAELGELEIADAVALPEMGASNGSWACCSSSSSSCCS
jgi:thiazolylpeptide-type bacteriocin precursor